MPKDIAENNDAADAGGQTLRIVYDLTSRVFVWLFQSLHTFSLLRRKGIAGDGVWYCLVWHMWHCLGCLLEATDPYAHCLDALSRSHRVLKRPENLQRSLFIMHIKELYRILMSNGFWLVKGLGRELYPEVVHMLQEKSNILDCSGGHGWSRWFGWSWRCRWCKRWGWCRRCSWRRRSDSENCVWLDEPSFCLAFSIFAYFCLAEAQRHRRRRCLVLFGLAHVALSWMFTRSNGPLRSLLRCFV